MSRTLPASPSPQSVARQLRGVAKLPAPRPARQTPLEATILLVDDDLGVLVSLARVFISEGWQVITATNGEEALERLAEQPPHIMITDLSMGDISGWDLLFHEKMQRPNLPIFVITALPPPAAGGADRFAAEFFQKPLDLEALVKAIRRRLPEADSIQEKATAI